MRARKALLASVVSLALLGASLNAHALALGAISVQSALGEPLRAEIEIPEISSGQAASLQASIATRQEFQAAGVDYSAALTGAQISLQHRANGQPYLRVLGTRSVNEPFINLVVNATWTDGHLRRDYTVLVNPPGRAALPAVVANTSRATPPQAPRANPAPVLAPAPTRTPASTPAPKSASAARLVPLSQLRDSPTEAAGTITPRRHESATATERPATVTARRNRDVTVRQGDTATGIARSSGLRGVSLDQMLVALLHSNPDAFINGNVNLVKAGAVVRIPSAEQARATSRTEARKLVVAQTQDFHAYRQRLAQGSRVKAPAEAHAAQETAGAVQSAKVNEQRAKEQPPDHLTVSKASSKDATVTQIAQSREEHAQTDRVAELAKNIQDLSHLESQAKTETKVASADQATAATAPAAAANQETKAATSASAASESHATSPTSESTPTSVAPAPSPSSPATAAAPSPAPAKGGTDVASAAAPAAAAQPAAKSPAIKVKVDPPPAPAAQPAWYDGLTENPSTLGLGAALVVLLAGLGLYNARRRKSRQAAAFADIGDDFDSDHDAGAHHPSTGSTAADKPKDRAATDATVVEKSATGAVAGVAALKAAPKDANNGSDPSALDLNLDMGDEGKLGAAAPADDEGEVVDFQPTAPTPRLPALDSDAIGNEEAAAAPTTHLPPSIDYPANEVQFSPPSAPSSTAASQKHDLADDKGMIDFDMDALPTHHEPAQTASAVDAPPQSSDDPLVTKLSLAQEFSNIGDDEGARSLAQEVVANATGELKKRAEDFLAGL